MLFAYYDPPYPGLSARYYGREESFAGEVDHAELIASAKASGYDGWALSTSAKALRDILPLCPPEARVCPWTKPIGVSTRTYGIHNAWEPVSVVPGRRLRGGVRDHLSAQPARLGGSSLIGRKPLAFVAWLWRLLGAQPGDRLVDVFPGSGNVGRMWAELSGTSLEPSATRAARSDAT